MISCSRHPTGATSAQVLWVTCPSFSALPWCFRPGRGRGLSSVDWVRRDGPNRTEHSATGEDWIRAIVERRKEFMPKHLKILRLSEISQKKFQKKTFFHYSEKIPFFRTFLRIISTFLSFSETILTFRNFLVFLENFWDKYQDFWDFVAIF